jgi:hypothetical protein
MRREAGDKAASFFRLMDGQVVHLLEDADQAVVQTSG